MSTFCTSFMGCWTSTSSHSGLMLAKFLRSLSISETGEPRTRQAKPMHTVDKKALSLSVQVTIGNGSKSVQLGSHLLKSGLRTYVPRTARVKVSTAGLVVRHWLVHGRHAAPGRKVAGSNRLDNGTRLAATREPPHTAVTPRTNSSVSALFLLCTGFFRLVRDL